MYKTVYCDAVFHSKNWKQLKYPSSIGIRYSCKRNKKAHCALLWSDLQNTWLSGKNKVWMWTVYIFCVGNDVKIQKEIMEE